MRNSGTNPFHEINSSRLAGSSDQDISLLVVSGQGTPHKLTAPSFANQYSNVKTHHIKVNKDLNQSRGSSEHDSYLERQKLEMQNSKRQVLNLKMPKILTIPVAQTVPENASLLDLSIMPGSYLRSEHHNSQTQIAAEKHNHHLPPRSNLGANA